MDQDPEIDNVSRARDLWRKNPKISASELKDALNLTNAKVATEILRSAIAKEQELKNKLAAEDAAAGQPKIAAQEVEQRFYLRDKVTGIAHRMVWVSETPRNVTFELENGAMTVVKG